MPNNDKAVFRCPRWTTLTAALKRAILGRSSHSYMKQFAGDNEYWERAIAAQQGWPQQQAPKFEPASGGELDH